MAVTNAQRDEIKALIKRRIEQARQKYLAEHKLELDALAASSKDTPNYAQMMALLDEMYSLQKQATELKKKFEQLYQELCAIPDSSVNNETHFYTPGGYSNLYAKNFTLGEELTYWPNLVKQITGKYSEKAAKTALIASLHGQRLKDLDEVETQLGDAAILATTDLQLRNLVDQVGKALGIVENEWLKKIVP